MIYLLNFGNCRGKKNIRYLIFRIPNLILYIIFSKISETEDINEHQLCSPETKQFTEKDTHYNENKITANNSGYSAETPENRFNLLKSAERFSRFVLSNDRMAQRITLTDLQPILLDRLSSNDNFLDSEPEEPIKQLVVVRKNSEQVAPLFETKQHKESLFETTKYQGSLTELNHGEGIDTNKALFNSPGPRLSLCQDMTAKFASEADNNPEGVDEQILQSQESKEECAFSSGESEGSGIDGGMELRPSMHTDDFENDLEELTDEVHPLNQNFKDEPDPTHSPQKTDWTKLGKENLVSENLESSVSPNSNRFDEINDNQRKIFAMNTISDKSKLDPISSKNSLNPMSPLLDPLGRMEILHVKGPGRMNLDEKVVNQFKGGSEERFAHLDSPFPVRVPVASPDFTPSQQRKDVFDFKKIGAGKKGVIPQGYYDIHRFIDIDILIYRYRDIQIYRYRDRFRLL